MMTMSSYLLDRERKQAQQALHNEDQKYRVVIGAHIPTAEEQRIEAWWQFTESVGIANFIMDTNPANYLRQKRIHQFSEQLTAKLAWENVTNWDKYLDMLDDKSWLEVLNFSFSTGCPLERILETAGGNYWAVISQYEVWQQQSKNIDNEVE